MKKILTSLMIFCVAGVLFAQTEGDAAANQRDAYSNLDAANPYIVGITSSEVRLKEVSVDKYENEGTWIAKMSSDEGIVQCRLFDGAPMSKEPIEDEEGMNIPDDKVLGVKVSFYRRGMNSFEVYASKPIPVEGITKTVSVWVIGRSIPHELNLIVEDYFGQRYELYVGKLNHAGWKQMTVAIPPQRADGKGALVQRNNHYGRNLGLKVVGFRIDCDLDESYGQYYIYFDDLRAVTEDRKSVV